MAQNRKSQLKPINRSRQIESSSKCSDNKKKPLSIRSTRKNGITNEQHKAQQPLCYEYIISSAPNIRTKLNSLYIDFLGYQDRKIALLTGTTFFRTQRKVGIRVISKPRTTRIFRKEKKTTKKSTPSAKKSFAGTLRLL